MEDTGRLRERVLDLQRHFGQANADIEKILTSSERIATRGRKIEGLEFDETPAAATIEHHAKGAAGPSPSASATRTDASERQRNGGARIVRQPDLLARE
jgi:DNA recombination protein RmuC